MIRIKPWVSLVLLFSIPVIMICSEERDIQLPVSRISLFSSGVGFFEHTGIIDGSARILLNVPVNSVNDILKSLVISDSSGTTPIVQYSGADSVYKALQSLSIDISGNPGLPDIIGKMTGEQIIVHAPDSITGRIISVDRIQTGEYSTEHALLLKTGNKIQTVFFSEISSLEFPDPAIAQDLERALDLLKTDKITDSRTIEIVCSGKGSRTVSVSYIMPVPVWKTSYRLDLSGKNSVFQGWAIIDNGGNFDWDRIRLSLVTGKPVSFIQNLYDPYYVERPVLPLAIAGSAAPVGYESGFGGYAEAFTDDNSYSEMAVPAPAAAKAAVSTRMYEARDAVVDGSMRAAATALDSGEQFLFTLNTPVSIPRQKSSMISLFNGSISTKRISVVSSDRSEDTSMIHPMLCIELENSTGLKLPAGPVTVYDSGLYAGDAVLEYLPENDKRLIGYGEDLPISVAIDASSNRELRTVRISKGVMIFSRSLVSEKKYRIRNADQKDRSLLIEHGSRSGYVLTSPQKADEYTSSGYRFKVNIKAGSESVYTVREEQPVDDRISLSGINIDAYASYASTAGIPDNIRTALQKAAGFRLAYEQADKDVISLEKETSDYERTQERIRLNLEAAGKETQQGREYLKKLTEADTAIEGIERQLVIARKKAAEARAAYETYVSSLTME